ncbi:MAG: 50S ribosomal protein L11 methyltransferase [Acidobacteria bacterium]|nr:50S ribosomal protein L11 methyltransferase [Acidobacteriota bacterium]MCA1639741.1 50S ribosomal protein L11 methyltransferase [Acidobacteriota bacterium]
MSDNKKLWFALEITADSQTSEAIEFALNELDSLGTEINNLGEDKSGETLCVVGYFNEEPNAEDVQNQLNAALQIYEFSLDTIKKIEWREVENTDWLAEWKRHWKPTIVGKFIVAPTWNEVKTDKSDDNPRNWEMIIRIDPEMAFGTGTHETTRLCLQAIQEIDTPGYSFLDVGTGTGILAIAVAKLKAQSSEFKVQNNLTHKSQLTIHNSISACDTDENSIEIARKNAALNNVDESIDFYIGSISEDTPEFNFVCANLTADVIVPLLPLLLKKTTFDLILSGILHEQQTLIENELKKLQVSDWKVRTLGEWIALVVRCQ